MDLETGAERADYDCVGEDLQGLSRLLQKEVLGGPNFRLTGPYNDDVYVITVTVTSGKVYVRKRNLTQAHKKRADHKTL